MDFSICASALVYSLPMIGVNQMSQIPVIGASKPCKGAVSQPGGASHVL